MRTVKPNYDPDSADEYAMNRAKLLFMGKSSMKGFVANSDGTLNIVALSGNEEVPANVCLVVRQVNGVWIKIGVLHVSQDLIFDLDVEQLNLNL